MSTTGGRKLGKALLAIAVLLVLALAGEAYAVSVYEYYNIQDDTYRTIFNPNGRAQTFTVNSTGHTVTIINLKLSRDGAPGICNVSIRATNASGYPTGVDLTVGTFDGISLNLNPIWFNVTVPEITLSSNTQYAIVILAPYGDNWNHIHWFADASSPAYSGGTGYDTADEGATWTVHSPSEDFMFEVYGNSIGADTTNPTYSSVSVNSTVANATCKFKCLWNDNVKVGGFIFSTNNTGTWNNNTWTSSWASWVNGTAAWAEATKSLNGTVGNVVSYRFYCNDTSNNWNNTGVWNLTVTGYGNYLFYGLLDEHLGTSLGAVNVTAYFSETGKSPETFQVDGSYSYSSSIVPQYFYVNLGAKHREYWPSSNETSATIYLYNVTSGLTTVQIKFRDLVGALATYNRVSVERYVNGTLRVVEKRPADIEKKAVFELELNQIYSVQVTNAYGDSYTFGDLAMTSTSMELTFKGIEFPQDVILAYQYVRIYGDRVAATPNGTITITYQDTKASTTSVVLQFRYNNGTIAYGPVMLYSNSFSYQWSNALNTTDYYVTCTINHAMFGAMTWKQYFPRSFSTAPFGMDFLGTWPVVSSQVIPALLIIFVFGCFSVLNAYVGAFFGTVTAAALAYMGWIEIPVGLLVAAFGFCALLGITYAKRRLLI